MDCAFYRTAEGRVFKCLTIVDGATHVAVAIEEERVISGQGVSRVLDKWVVQRGLPRVIRTDRGKKFCGKAVVAWAHEKGVALRLIEPGKRTKMLTSSHSMGGCATNASTSSGSQHCFMSIPAWKAGGGTSTRKDPSERLAR